MEKQLTLTENDFDSTIVNKGYYYLVKTKAGAYKSVWYSYTGQWMIDHPLTEKKLSIKFIPLIYSKSIMKKTNNILSEFANHKSDAVNIECSEFEKLENDFGDYLKSTSMNNEKKTPHNFCKTPEEKCTMNYCDENGCQNRKRHLVEENKQLPTALEMLKSVGYDKNSGLSLELCAKHMGEFLDLHTVPLREELEKLRAENERLKVEKFDI